MIRDIIIKVHYVTDDDLLAAGVIKMTSASDVEKFLRPELEEIFADTNGYRGLSITVEDKEVI